MSVQRLIDANALIEEIRELLYTENRPSMILNNFSTMCFNSAIELAEIKALEAPTIDAVPAVHGRWIYGVTLNHEWRKCSECLVSQEIFGCFTYCPNCGAKMDGGAE